MPHSHSKRSASISGACLFGVADEDEGKLKPLSAAQGWGGAKFLKSKAGNPSLGTHSWGASEYS